MGLLLLGAAAAEAQTPTCSVAAMQNQVWTGNLTVGTKTVLGETVYGWDDSGGFTGASLTDQDFTFGGDTYDLDQIFLVGGLTLAFDPANVGDIATQATRNKLTLHIGSATFNLGVGALATNQRTITWSSPGLTWAASDSVCLALTSTPPPAVSSVALTSAPGTDNTYAIGDSVTATVTFDAAVDITGTPQLELDFNGTAKAAACATGTNTTTMACSYTVAVGDSAPNGVGIAANKLTGGTIRATGSTTITADLDHSVVSIDTGHKVDGIRPTLVTTGDDAPTTSTDGTQVILTFSEDLSAFSIAGINLSVGGVGGQSQGATASFSGRTVTVTLHSVLTIEAGQTVTVQLVMNAVQDAAGNGILAVAATTVNQRRRRPHGKRRRADLRPRRRQHLRHRRRRRGDGDLQRGGGHHRHPAAGAGLCRHRGKRPPARPARTRPRWRAATRWP